MEGDSFMTYAMAKKVKVGDSLLMKPHNYRATTVLEISEDQESHALFFRCTDGLFYHGAVIPALSPDKLGLLYMKNPKTKVYIYHNNDTGVWQYSVEVVDSGGFWLDSFESEEEARDYIAKHKLCLCEDKAVAQ